MPNSAFSCQTAFQKGQISGILH